ncbi:hypothetical protein HYDPIDRAFT_112679 [Hydnomerulius pinastri MD-312]|uniref:Uncharacterized protein n=1 Tax=Hydnomerulius pinastri MD-312 TaxID=994086 RepID=A0A0C9VE08_9AGAM|nr:hypothetical protein HYDPIDRAFT_112679 [Hydnomerulius pinastri MD-312]
MVKCRVVLSVTYHINFCLAWSWTAHSRGGSTFQDTSTSLGDSELFQDDLRVLLKSQGALETYTKKPDCFQDAIALVKTRCEESHMDEQERVQAAISMTLCELATARHYSPPLECATFAWGREEPSSTLAQAQCVEALSRSAQYWSSYSGYLREIPQLCFAFRRWIDIGNA